MTNSKNLLIGAGILVAMVSTMLLVDLFQRRQLAAGSPEQPPGAIPIYLDDELISQFTPTDLDLLEMASFVDLEEGKTQEGWLLADVLLLHLDPSILSPEDIITVSSNSKTVDLSWSQVSDQTNLILFDLSGRGSLKLVSAQVEGFQTRDKWIQDVTRIEISTME